MPTTQRRSAKDVRDDVDLAKTRQMARQAKPKSKRPRPAMDPKRYQAGQEIVAELDKYKKFLGIFFPKKYTDKK